MVLIALDRRIFKSLWRANYSWPSVQIACAKL